MLELLSTISLFIVLVVLVITIVMLVMVPTREDPEESFDRHVEEAMDLANGNH